MRTPVWVMAFVALLLSCAQAQFPSEQAKKRRVPPPSPPPVVFVAAPSPAPSLTPLPAQSAQVAVQGLGGGPQSVIPTTPTPTPTPTPIQHLQTVNYGHGQSNTVAIAGASDDTPAGGTASAAPFTTIFNPGTANGCDAFGPPEPTCATYSSYGLPGLSGIAPNQTAVAIPAARVYQYVDPNLMGNGDPGWLQVCGLGADPAHCDGSATLNSALARDCSNTLVVYNSTRVVADPYQAATITLWNTIINSKNFNQAPWYNKFFIDDVGSALQISGSNAPCHSGVKWSSNVTALATAYNVLIAALTITVNDPSQGSATFLLNAGAVQDFQSTSGASTALANLVTGNARITHVVYDNGYVSSFLARDEGFLCSTTTTGCDWRGVANGELQLAALGKAFLEEGGYGGQNVGGVDTPLTGAQNLTARFYDWVSTMLVWDPTSTYFQSRAYGLAQNGGLQGGTNQPQLHSAFPEFLFTAYGPLVAAPTNVATLSSGGIYFREYAHCYLWDGVLAHAPTESGTYSPCVFMVNPDSASGHARPTTTNAYAHTLTIAATACPNTVLNNAAGTTINGACDFYGGGSLSMVGATIPGTVPALGAYVGIP